MICVSIEHMTWLTRITHNYITRFNKLLFLKFLDEFLVLEDHISIDASCIFLAHANNPDVREAVIYVLADFAR